MERSNATLHHQPSAPLAHLTVIDAGGRSTALLGRMLADLGARVLESEPADGWPESGGADIAAFRETLRRGKQPLDRVTPGVLGSADVVLCRTLADVGLDIKPEKFTERFPAAILVTITALGSSGPAAEYPESDLTTLAASGYLHMTGPEDGPPIKPSVPFLSWRFADVHGLAGLAIALRRRRLTGCGSHVDVAARDTGLWMLTHTYQYWDMERINLRRKGADRDVGRAGVRIPSVFPCKDGTIIWMLLSGQLGKGSVDRLVDWMDSSGMAPGWLKQIDWETLVLEDIPDLDAFIDPFRRFFLTKTRAELLARAVEDGFMIAPVNHMADLLSDPHLEDREVWVYREVAGSNVRIPRAPFRSEVVTWEPGE